jgi:hypothetical protein
MDFVNQQIAFLNSFMIKLNSWFILCAFYNTADLINLSRNSALRNKVRQFPKIKPQTYLSINSGLTPKLSAIFLTVTLL